MMRPGAGGIAELTLGAARQSLVQFGAERHGERVTTTLSRQARLPRAIRWRDFRYLPQQIG